MCSKKEHFHNPIRTSKVSTVGKCHVHMSNHQGLNFEKEKWTMTISIQSRKDRLVFPLLLVLALLCCAGRVLGADAQEYQVVGT
jgi:hypothetical protein